MPELREIHARLRLPESDAGWYAAWEALPPPATPMPVLQPTESARLLREFGVDEATASEAVRGLPTPEDETLWWVAERCYRQLVSDMGGLGLSGWKWPRLDAMGEAGRFTYLYPLLAALPHTRDFYSSRGIPADVLNDTMGNLAEKLALNRERFGAPGLDIAFWFSLHVRGTLFRLGRLEFAMEVLPQGHPFTGIDASTLTLGIHIPGHAGPLSLPACQDSIRRARDFFGTYFADRFPQKPIFTCTSWLLDPQLREFLAPDSHIVSFQELFQLVPAEPDATARGEKDVLQFVFNHTGEYDAARLPRDTRLRAHLADGLASGRGWQTRGGWFA